MRSTKVTEKLWPNGPSKIKRHIGMLRNGKFRVRPRLPVRREIKHVDYILGGTFHRVSLLSCTKNSLKKTIKQHSHSIEIVTACIKETTDSQKKNNCDMCYGEQHRPTNAVCSATLNAGASPLLFGTAYCAITKEPAFKLSINDCTILEQTGPVQVCQFKLVHVS